MPGATTPGRIKSWIEVSTDENEILHFDALVSIATLGWISALAGTEAIPADSDLGRLQGRWTARAGARQEVRVILTIQGRQVDATIRTPQGISFEVQGEVRLDETTSPRSLIGSISPAPISRNFRKSQRFTSSTATRSQSATAG